MHPLASPIYIRTTGTHVTHLLLSGPLWLLWLTFFIWTTWTHETHLTHIFIFGILLFLSITRTYIYLYPGPLWPMWLNCFYSDSFDSPISIRTPVTHVTHLFLSELLWLLWLTYFYPDSCDSCDSPISIRTPVTLVTEVPILSIMGSMSHFLYSFLNTTGIKPMTIDQYVGVLAT